MVTSIPKHDPIYRSTDWHPPTTDTKNLIISIQPTKTCHQIVTSIVVMLLNCEPRKPFGQMTINPYGRGGRCENRVILRHKTKGYGAFVEDWRSDREKNKIIISIIGMTLTPLLCTLIYLIENQRSKNIWTNIFISIYIDSYIFIHTQAYCPNKNNNYNIISIRSNSASDLQNSSSFLYNSTSRPLIPSHLRASISTSIICWIYRW